MPPKIYLTNAGSVVQVGRGRATPETAACVGPRHGHITIMARPRPPYGEMGIGQVKALAPPVPLLLQAKSGWIDFEEYRVAFLQPLVAAGLDALQPGRLTFVPWDASPESLVRDGDTLTCACGRKAAIKGECHRVWSAGMLALAGWLVILDGVELDVGRAREVIALPDAL